MSDAKNWFPGTAPKFSASIRIESVRSTSLIVARFSQSCVFFVDASCTTALRIHRKKAILDFHYLVEDRRVSTTPRATSRGP